MQVTFLDSSATPAQAARPRIDSVERTLGQVGDAWSFLILREAFFGVHRFDAILKNLGASPNILTSRLKKLVAHGLLTRNLYRDKPPRFEYRLTEKGEDLYPAIVLLMRWGDRWLDEGKGAPLELIHKPCQSPTRPVLTCDVCKAPVAARDIAWQLGPGSKS